MADTDFNVENLRVKDLPPIEPRVTKPRRRRHEFVQISRRQLAILRQGKASAAAWNVFAELVWLSWKDDGKPIKFTNYGLAGMNISHDSRTRAIRELEKLGLIRIDHVLSRKRKSPMLTVLELDTQICVS
jgi:hypothetical protein